MNPPGAIIMMFDLTKKSPTIQEIGAERDRLDKERDNLNVRTNRILRCVWLAVVTFLILGVWAAEGFWVLVFCAGGFVCACFAEYLRVKLDEKLSVVMAQRALLNELDERCCVEIQHWLGDSVIAAYRNSVVGQGRKFVMAEAEAMRANFIGANYRRVVEDASRAVYGDVLPGV
jgi:hypothetical protein